MICALHPAPALSALSRPCSLLSSPAPTELASVEAMICALHPAPALSAFPRPCSLLSSTLPTELVSVEARICAPHPALRSLLSRGPHRACLGGSKDLRTPAIQRTQAWLKHASRQSSDFHRSASILQFLKLKSRKTQKLQAP
jgi:hypothetical protein